MSVAGAEGGLVGLSKFVAANDDVVINERGTDEPPPLPIPSFSRTHRMMRSRSSLLNGSRVAAMTLTASRSSDFAVMNRHSYCDVGCVPARLSAGTVELV